MKTKPKFRVVIDTRHEPYEDYGGPYGIMNANDEWVTEAPFTAKKDAKHFARYLRTEAKKVEMK